MGVAFINSTGVSDLSSMRVLIVLFQLAVFAAASQARAQEVAIGVAAPLDGSFARLGEQWLAGARAAAGQDGSVRLVEANSSCSEEGGRQAAQRLVEAEVSVVIGFLCTPAVEAAMPVFAQAGNPVITPVRTDSLTDNKDRTGWPVFRLGPRASDERDAVADILIPHWREEFFAIIDDGTIYGRELAENLRAEAELAGLNPVLFDTFRPQLDNQIGLVGRLRRAGATHVFVGGDRADVAIMARDARELGYNVTFASGDVVRAEDGPVPLPAGVLMIGLPQWADLASERTLAALRSEGIVPEGYVVPGYAALEVAAAAAREAGSQGMPIAEILRNASFETALGTVRFNAKGDLERDLYRLFRYDGEKFVEVQ